MKSPIIEVNALSKRFGPRNVLRKVDWHVTPGSVVGLLGANGSGKSTLIKCLLGLLAPTTGNVRILGEDAWKLSAASKEKLGYVSQTPQLYPWMTVDQIIRYVGAFYQYWDSVWATDLVERWTLAPSKQVGSLSHGELQKLSLVLALGHRPALLILDEPVASLDPMARRAFLRSLLELTSDSQHTVVFSTHITSDLERVASHVALLRDGEIAMFDEIDAIKDRVKRLRITASQPLPATFAIPGALRMRVEGCNAFAAVAELDERLIATLETKWNAAVAVEDLNLEEIFLEMHHD